MLKIASVTQSGLGRAETGEHLPRVLPGEEVEQAADGSVRIITASPDRVAAPCRHFKSCGGCAMQHAADSFVADWKCGIVTRALSAHGIAADIRRIETSPPNSRRRAKLAGRRTKKGTLIGFHGRASDTLIEVPDCQLMSPALMAAMPALHAITAIAASRKAEVALTVTESTSGPDIHIDTEKELTPQIRVELAAVGQSHGVARLVWKDEPVVTLNPPAQRFGKALVLPPPGAFLQATKAGEASLLGSVRDIVGGAKRIADLFSGCGTFALPLAEGADVHAVEGEPEMVAALDRGWRETTGLHRVTTESRDLFRRPLLPDELARFDAIVIDPPRAGCEAQIREVAASDVGVVAMVSCNPVTFARDAKTLLDSGFALTSIDVVDQFRWSPHVELVGGFRR